MTFPEFLLSLGIIPPKVIEPGKWIRCATQDHPQKRNGSIKLFPDGNAGVAQNHGVTEAVTWRREGSKLPPERIEIIRKRIHDDEERRLAREALATEIAWDFFEKECLPLRNCHPYLEKKSLGLMGCSNMKVDEGGKLVIPIFRGKGQFLSLQIIDDDGGKKFWTGAPVSGGRFNLWRKEATITILCEGVATGLTLFAAVPDSTVVVGFNASNMEAVARTRRWSGLCVVAADNDLGTRARIGRNPGVLSATNAAAAIGCKVAAPAIDGDWNDLYAARLAELTKAEEVARFKRSREALVQLALLPVKAGVMRALTFIESRK